MIHRKPSTAPRAPRREPPATTTDKPPVAEISAIPVMRPAANRNPGLDILDIPILTRVHNDPA